MEGRTIIYRTLIGTFALAILGYTGFVLYDFVRGPRIIIQSPQTGFSTTSPVVNISGKAIHISNLSINDEETPFSLEGDFQSRLILAEGYNIIRITAKDRYERVVDENIEINLLPQFKEKATSTQNMATTTEDYTATSTINN